MTNLYLKHGNGVIKHLNPNCQHFATFFWCGRRRSRTSTIHASRRRMWMVHAGTGWVGWAAARGQLPQRAARIMQVVIHGLLGNKRGSTGHALAGHATCNKYIKLVYVKLVLHLKIMIYNHFLININWTQHKIM